MNRIIKFRAWNKETKKIVDLNAITPFALAIIPSNEYWRHQLEEK